MPFQRTQNVTYDGEHYKEEIERIMFSSNYYLSENMKHHKRLLHNITELLAEFGGLFTLVSKAFIIIGIFMNTRVHSAAMLNEMYYLKLSNKKNKTKGMWTNLNKFTSNLYELTFSQID